MRRENVTEKLSLENVRIGFRNFSGKEGEYNPAGNRNFCVFLDSELAEHLEEQGWNVRWLQPRDESEQPAPYLQVSLSYKNVPPKIVLITSSGKTKLDEEDVSMLDWIEIEKADLIINPYNWEVSKKRGVKAYLKTMYVTMAEDEFEAKYKDVPDSALKGIVNEEE